ncbi:MAG: zinc metalloprotease HtpX, partial [Planctomycetota bacterium]|nr:zinc metalloprotease HtpX [Planctomycetota bacterium]
AIALVLGSAGAQEITKVKDPELVNVVEEMAIPSGLPRPKIYIIPDRGMNAFATRIAPDRSAVVVTIGPRA